MVCLIENEQQCLNDDDDDDDDDEAVVAPRPMQLSLASRALVSVSSVFSFGPSSSLPSPSRKPPSSDYSRLLRRSPKRNEESIATINKHARHSIQRCHCCSSGIISSSSPTRFKTIAFLTLLLGGTCLWRSGMDMLQTAVNLSVSIGLVHHYESNIYTERFRSFLDRDIRPDYFPFLLKGNTLLCPRVHPEFLFASRPRDKAAIEMIHTGLEMYQRDDDLDFAKRKNRRDPLPILIVNNDQSGCNTTTRLDDYDFPRLTWSVPALKHHMAWCQIVPMPSYEIWRDYKNHSTEESWNTTFALQVEQHPWENKTNLALWRGTTTYDYNYTGHDLNDTPRGRLVRLSMRHPDLIDAGFVRLNQQYENATFTEENTTILTERMKFDDMSEYKAIIDIDGNDWSSRFPKLLCMNSVVIKVCL